MSGKWNLEGLAYEKWVLGKRKLHIWWPPAPRRGLAWETIKREHYPYFVSTRELEEHGWRKAK
jgi:hypothetical protein